MKPDAGPVTAHGQPPVSEGAVLHGTERADLYAPARVSHQTRHALEGRDLRQGNPLWVRQRDRQLK